MTTHKPNHYATLEEVKADAARELKAIETENAKALESLPPEKRALAIILCGAIHQCADPVHGSTPLDRKERSTLPLLDRFLNKTLQTG